MTEGEIHKNFYNAIVNAFNSLIAKTKFNYTVEGTIMAVLGNNQYTVNINGLEYTVVGTTMPASSYVVGNIVLIEVVNNNFSRKYIKCLKPYK